jgi:hypothetical protein
MIRGNGGNDTLRGGSDNDILIVAAETIGCGAAGVRTSSASSGTKSTARAIATGFST